MTEEQILLYGTLWLGPLMLLLVVGFYLWSDHGPITKRGQEKMRRHRERTRAELREYARKRAEGVAGPTPSSQNPAQGNVER